MLLAPRCWIIVLPTYLQLLASAVVSPTIVVGVRTALSNVSFEIPRSILISSASRGVAEGRELKYSRKPVRERQTEQTSHSTISTPKTISATRVSETAQPDAQVSSRVR